MATASCSECAAQINLPPTIVKSEILQCPDCGVELEVTSLDPPRLEIAPREEEDWGE